MNVSSYLACKIKRRSREGLGSGQIAVEGCCHGELDSTYAHIARMEAQNGYKVDCLLINGDFQAIRNHQDLQCMAVPIKYKRLGGFHRCGSLILFLLDDSACSGNYIRILLSKDRMSLTPSLATIQAKRQLLC